MTSIAMSDLGGEYARIFGPREETAAGRSRLCNVCGSWHPLDKPRPHNCRPEPPPRSPLAAPRLAPKFEPFVAGDVENPVIINDHRDKRAYMDQHDMVEYDAGVEAPEEPTSRQFIDEFAEDFKAACEIDPLNRPPTEVLGRTDLEGADEIDPETVEVAK